MTTIDTAGPATSETDRSRWRTLAASGLAGACIPTVYGGAGFGAVGTALELERAGYDHLDTGLVFGVAAHLLACAVPIRDLASEATRRELLPGLCSGQLIASNAITEPGAGSDVGSLRTTAVAIDGGYLLRGVKSFASNGPIADVFVTYASTAPGDGYLGLSGFAVDGSSPGIVVTPLDKMGLHGCPAGRVEFRDVYVPAGRILGEPGSGGPVFQHSMAWERTCLFAIYLGCMRRVIERCVEHGRNRRQWGRAIGDFQAVSHRIADMHRRMLAARHLLLAAAQSLDDGDHDAVLISSSKVTTSEAAVSVASDAIQIFGGAGYLTGTGIERELRDAVPGQIFSGTNDVHRGLIAGGLGL